MKKIPEQQCKSCGHVIKHSTDLINDTLPKPGDVTVCIGCGTISRFNYKYEIVKLEPHEIEIIKRKQPDTWKTIKAVSEAIVNGIMKINLN
jgi:RNase P subunit RPR2